MKRVINTWMVIMVMVLSGAFTHASAQDDGVDLDELLNGHVHKVDEVLYSNLTFIQQAGGENQVKAIQEQQGTLSNFIEIEQLNRGNSAYIEQTGSGHRTMLLQKGNGNEANLWSEGNLTATKARQIGDGNRIDSYLSNYSTLPKGALLVQEGSNNTIEFALTGKDGYEEKALAEIASIRQTGNDLQVSALFESLDSPVQIDQQSGPGGGGMKVDVSTSVFYFPMKR